MADETNDFQVNVKVLQKHIDDLAGKQKSISEATGTLRSALKAILENEGYHSKAMAIIRQIDNMSDTQLADFCATFKPMFEAMWDHKWAAKCEDMLSGVE